MHAFDTRVVLVCLRTSDDRSAQVVGAVPLSGAMARTAATATLDATNRLVDLVLDQAEDETAGGKANETDDGTAGGKADETKGETAGEK